MAQAALNAPSRLLTKTGSGRSPPRGGLGRGEADLQHIASATSMEDGAAAAAFAVGVISSATGASMPACCSARDDEIALPGSVGSHFQVLHGAAAANTEVRAERSNALGARLFQCGEVAAGRGVQERCQLRPLPRVKRQVRRLARPRHPLRHRRDGRAGRSQIAQPRSASTKNSRLPSPPRIGEGMSPPTRQPSEAKTVRNVRHRPRRGSPRPAQCLFAGAAPRLELRFDQCDERGARIEQFTGCRQYKF